MSIYFQQLFTNWFVNIRWILDSFADLHFQNIFWGCKIIWEPIATFSKWTSEKQFATLVWNYYRFFNTDITIYIVLYLRSSDRKLKFWIYVGSICNHSISQGEEKLFQVDLFSRVFLSFWLNITYSKRIDLLIDGKICLCWKSD